MIFSLECTENFHNYNEHIVTHRNKNQARYVRVNDANQIDELEVVNSQIAPGCGCHQLLIFEHDTKIIIELIEAKTNSGC